MGIRRSEELVKSEFTTDEDGNPTGGHTWLEVYHYPNNVIRPSDDPTMVISWQDGIVGDDGQTGAFVEDVIEAARQRLLFFQESSKFACRDNALAITALEEALQRLDWRTRQRVISGIENTYEVHDS